MNIPKELLPYKRLIVDLESQLIESFGYSYTTKPIKLIVKPIGKRTIGNASSRTHEVRISSDYLPYLDEDEIKEVIRHEFAHIASFMDMMRITGFSHQFSKDSKILSHGKNWKKWARKFGATPKAKTVLKNNSKNNYRLFCTKCSKTLGGYKRMSQEKQRLYEIEYYVSKCCRAKVNVVKK